MIRYFWPSDDEQLAGQAVDSHFDEDGGWWANVQQCGAAFALVVAATLTAGSTAVASSVFSQEQDIPAGNLTPLQLAQEEYWINPVAPVVWPQPSVLTDDDVHPTFVATFAPAESDYQPLVAPIAATNFVQLPINGRDVYPQFPAPVNPVDDSAIWSPNSPPWEPTWTLLFFLDDGSVVPVFQPDEDFWANPVPPYNWPQPAQPFATPDDDFQVPEFVAAEDPIWLQLVPPDPGSLIWPQPFIFEQNESTNLIAFTTEEYWQNPTPPVADSLYVLRQDVFDEQAPVGFLTLILDDAFQAGWSPFVPQPDPGSLRLLQQWPFEQNEPAGSLRNTVDEDFWINPVRPVVWPQPSIFVFDEQTIGQPVASKDEDFWNLLVAPVPATNYIRLPYLPDPEEIPAGSLVPFIPTPPLFCPVPPPGPDADVSMSIFSNFKGGPTLALFCRICKSGKPLVVRADYAIWCQDCCAFVSKADTYMGTVQAPGAFRGKF